MTEVFISAETENDIHYAEYLRDKLKATYMFQVHLIVQDRYPNSEIVKLIQDSIFKSKYFVPILTKNSFQNQWVNQEIGYATALKKTFYPLIEEVLVSKLRGFVALTHKFDFKFDINHLEEIKGEQPHNFVSNIKETNLNNFIKIADDFVSFLNDKEKPIYASELDGVDMNGAKIYLHNKRALLLHHNKWHWIKEHKVTELLMNKYKIKIDKSTRLDEKRYPKGKEIHFERIDPQPPVKDPFE